MVQEPVECYAYIGRYDPDCLSWGPWRQGLRCGNMHVVLLHWAILLVLSLPLLGLYYT